jgi:hypothetical protein
VIIINKLESLNRIKYNLEKQITKYSKQNKDNSFDDGYQKGMQLSFETFTSLLNQYIKYKDNVKLLMKEQNETWKKWVSYYEKQNNISKSDYNQRFNTWLFDYIFNKGIYQLEEKMNILDL